MNMNLTMKALDLLSVSHVSLIITSYIVNHYEVNIIRKYYKKLQKYTTGFCLIYRKFKTSSVNGLDFLDALNIKTSPFYTSLFRIYGINRNLILIENDSLNFNDFFQFVIFFSLNSTVALYYCIHIIHSSINYLFFNSYFTCFVFLCI